MNIRQIVDKHYNNQLKDDITVAELNAFVEEYKNIKELKKRYDKGDENRKVLGLEIFNRAEDLKSMLHIIDYLILDKNKEFDYRFPDQISDYEKAFKVLLDIANASNDKYLYKRFNVHSKGVEGTKYGDRKTVFYNGEILVIGEKNTIDKIEKNGPYQGSKFRTIATKLINKNKSLITLTDYYFDRSILPFETDVKANVYDFKVASLYRGICCYTHNDELEIAVNNLKNYINVYGGNIDNISIETIIYRINKLNNSDQKKLIKKP